jgi:hypothetical protein
MKIGLVEQESKSLEERMANTLEQPAVDSAGFVSEDARRLAQQRHAEHERHRQALNLQRENILSQKTSNPARRTALEAALAQIDAEIQATE